MQNHKRNGADGLDSEESSDSEFRAALKLLNDYDSYNSEEYGECSDATVNKLPEVTHYSYWSLLRPYPIVMAHYRRDFHAKI